MKIAIITAGGAGMFCGSCMQDNTLARALQGAGHDVTLVPTYTPITVDETDVSDGRVFLGGVNVYLDSVVPGWSRLPRFLKNWLDRPGILRRLTRRSSATDATQLGWLTVDMLKGNQGPQRSEFAALSSWLIDDLQPEVILFSNALLSGIVPELRQRFDGQLICLLQGDDVFLDALPARWQQPAVKLVSENCRHFDRLLTHSRWYADHLSKTLSLDRSRIDQIPLSLDCDLPALAENRDSDQPTIGYFARVCPEKGVDNFLDAVKRVAPRDQSLQFRIAGYLPELHASWFHERLKDARQEVGADRLQWLGSPETRNAKLRILQTFDILCVPANYHEPKGIFLLEAALAGVPSLVPHHGAFPERIDRLGCGWTYPGESAAALDDALLESCGEVEPSMAAELQRAVRDNHSMETTGQEIGRILQNIVSASERPAVR